MLKVFALNLHRRRKKDKSLPPATKKEVVKMFFMGTPYGRPFSLTKLNRKQRRGVHIGSLALLSLRSFIFSS
jgi:hypothetical protein